MPEFTFKQVKSHIMDDPAMQQLVEDDPTEFDSKATAIFRAFGYREDGSELPLAQRGIQKVARATGIPEPVMGAVAALPIPLMTTAAGAIGFSALAGPGPQTPATAAVGAMTGSLYGEEINAAAGIIDPLTTGEKSLALGAPLLGPLAVRLGPKALKLLQRLPGSQFGVHEQAGNVFDESLKKIRVDEGMVSGARNLMNVLPDVKVPMPGLQALIKGEKGAAGLAKEFPGSKQYMDALSSLEEEIAKGPMSMKKIMAWERAANFEKSAGSGEVWGKMAGTIIDDLEQASMNPKFSNATRDKIGDTVKNFKMYVSLKNKYNADEALDNLYKRVVKPVADDPSLIQFNKKAFVEEMRSNKALKNFWSSKEREEIVDAISDIGYISKTVGSSVQKYTLAGATLTAGSAGLAQMGVPYTGSMAVILGGVTALRMAIGSELGRKVLKHVSLVGNGKVDLNLLTSMLDQVSAASSTATVAAAKGARDNPVNPFGNMK